MVIRYLFVLLTLSSLLLSCSEATEELPAPPKTKSNAFDGTYKFSNDTLGLQTKNLNAEFWTLTIEGESGTLAFTEAARGLYSFHCTIRCEQTEQRMVARFESVVYPDFFSRESLDTLRRGQVLFEMELLNRTPVIVKEHITQLQYEFLQPGIHVLEIVE